MCEVHRLDGRASTIFRTRSIMHLRPRLHACTDLTDGTGINAKCPFWLGMLFIQMRLDLHVSIDGWSNVMLMEALLKAFDAIFSGRP
jgi:hypothetical protein